jgi:ribosome-associated heat shock protein Hsp15
MNPQSDSIRFDRLLWQLRFYPTRTRATEACNGGEAKIDGERSKPSKELKTGQHFSVRTPLGFRDYQILAIPNRRISAKEKPAYCLETTTPEVLAQMQSIREDPTPKRDRGAGRPTKKEKRQFNSLFFGNLDN